MFAILIHIYYSDSWENVFREQLLALKKESPVVMINLSMDIQRSSVLATSIKKDFPSAFIITTPNKGKDIGGKLALINFFLTTEQKAEFIIFLHDKISPYSISGDKWRTNLFSIIDPPNITSILSIFDRNASIGIIAAKDFIRDEFNAENRTFETTNNKKLKELISLYNLTITNHTFVAGTMFWIRSSIIQNFFSEFSPLDCRELLEEGNTTDQHDGTYTHSWERLFCWLANDQQFTLKGI